MQRISERRILKTVKYGKIKVARFRIRWLVQVGKKEAPGYLGVAGGFEQRKIGIFFWREAGPGFELETQKSGRAL